MKKLNVLALLLVLNSPAIALAAAPAPTGGPPATAAAQRTIDVNRAGVAELVTVPGIGPRLAEAIIELRDRKGGFSKLEELLEVRGIGERNFAAVAPYLAVAPLPAAPVAGKQ